MDANGRFQAVGSRLSDVLRIEIGGQVARGHDLILEFVIEISDVQNRAVVRHALLDARIIADAFLGLQRGIVRNASSNPSGARKPVPKLACRRVPPKKPSPSPCRITYAAEIRGVTFARVLAGIPG